MREPVRRRKLQPRTVLGLRVRGHRGHPEVRRAVVRFARWLRSVRPFPTNLPIYLLSRERVRTLDGRLATASFFAPLSPASAPYIRIATGDYPQLKRTRGRDNALAAYLCSVAHELVHYDQWGAGSELTEQGVARRASELVDRYARDVDRP
jgi:hypothetical protein